MNRADPIADLLRAPQYAGAPVEGAKTAVAGSVRRGCAVQLSARLDGERLADPRYHAFGGPGFIAACEHVARVAEGQPPAGLSDLRAADWLEALGLSRDTLAELLVLEDAWRGLVAALVIDTEDT